MSSSETSRGGQTEEGVVNDINRKIGILASELVDVMKASGGISTGLPIQRENVNYTVISSGTNGRTKLILHASGLWSRRKDGIVSGIGNTETNENLDRFLAEFATIVSAQEIGRALRYSVTPETMRAIADESLPIEIRRGLYSKHIGPRVKDFVVQNRLPLLQLLQEDLQQAHVRITPQ